MNSTDGFEKMFAKLNCSYGLRNLNVRPKNPTILLDEVDNKLAQLDFAGGTITDLRSKSVPGV